MNYTDVNTTAAKEHRKEFTIIVNGQRKEVRTDELSFEQVVDLAYNGHPPTGPNWVFTVTYRNADGKKHDGSLTKGESVKIKNGTVFNVTATDKS